MRVKNIRKAYKFVLTGILSLCSVILVSIIFIAFSGNLQSKLASIVVNKVNKQHNLNSRIGSIAIKFPASIELTDVFIPDKQNDTLFYSETIKLKTRFLKALLKKQYEVKSLYTYNTRIKLYKPQEDTILNVEELFRAFANKNTETNKNHEKEDIDFGIKNIELINTDFSLYTISTHDSIGISYKRILVKLSKTDFSSNSIDIRNFELEDGGVVIHPNKCGNDNISEVTFLKNWNIEASKIVLSNNHFTFHAIKTTDSLNGFNPEHFSISMINSKINNVQLSKNSVGAKVRNITFREKKGLYVKNIATNLKIDSTGIDLQKCNITTETSNVNAEIATDINIFTQHGLFNPNTNFHILFKNALFSAYDLSFFHNNVNHNQLDSLLVGEPINCLAEINGSPSLLYYNISLKNNAGLKLDLKGEAGNILAKEKIQINTSKLELSTSDKFLNSLIHQKLADYEIKVPGNISLKGNVKVNKDSLFSNFEINTPKDKFLLHTTISDLSDSMPSWQTGFTCNNLNPNDYYALPSNLLMKNITLLAEIEGKGLNGMQMNSTGKIDLLNVNANGINYEKIKINYTYLDKILKIGINSSDKNLKGTFTGQADFNKSPSLFIANASISNLHLTNYNKDSAKFNLNGNVQFNVEGSGLDDFSASLEMNSTNLHSDEKDFYINLFEAHGKADTSYSHFSVNSDFLKGTYKGSLPIQQSYKAVWQNINSHILIDGPASQWVPHGNYNLELNVYNADWVKLFKDEGLPETEGLFIENSYDAQNNQIEIRIKSDQINYAGNRIDSVKFSFTGQGDSANYSLSTDSVFSFNNTFKKIAFNGGVKSNEITTYLHLPGEKNETLLGINGKFSKPDSVWSFSLFEDGLVLDDEIWKVNHSNNIRFTKNLIKTSNFTLTNKEQKFTIYSIRTDSLNNPVEINIENMDLTSIFKIINQQTEDISGVLNAEVKLQNTGEKLSNINANINLNDFRYYEHFIGNIVLLAKSDNGYTINLDLNYNDQGNIVTTKGLVYLNEKKMDLLLQIDRLNLGLLSPFINEYITDISGNVSGKVLFKGTFNVPEINGDINLQEVKFLPVYLNVPFTIKQGDFNLTNEEVNIKKLEIQDVNGNASLLSGYIQGEGFKINTSKIEVTTKNLMVLNTTKKENPLFYGKIFLDSKILITGTPESPKITLDANVNKGSHLTYVVPEEPDIIEDENLVVFVSYKEEQNAGIDITEEFRLQQNAGIEMDATLNIDNETEIKIVLDEYAGDYLKLKGSANDFKYSVKPGGELSLIGKYEITKGNYFATFYEFTNRNFEIFEGSSITWTGNPLDANIDVTAKYKIKTSPVPLLENEELNQTAFDKNAFRKQDRFTVNLNIKNQLINPDLSFSIEKTENKNASPNDILNSVLYRLNQNENELNKQVFGLLLFGQFLPQSSWLAGSDRNIFQSKVEEETGRYLSNYLNNFAGKNIPWFNLETQVDLNNINTSGVFNEVVVGIELSKQLFNDRLVVVVGESVNIQNSESNQFNAENFGGDVKIEYLITKDGNIKLETSRKKNNKSIIDGELIENSIGISFTKKFSKKRKKK